MALISPAHAQQASEGSEPLEEVVVTGLRQSLESAQAIKKNSDQIVDSVTAQDIGALPDRSVSEALQRIPGITLQRTNEAHDPSRLAGEGGGVFIRGLSWVRSEANGRDIFSANNGRGLSFEDVSADLLAGVDVYKNPSAEMIEGGIGGTVDLRTRLPFDSKKRLLAFAADYNYADLKQEGFTSGSALYSDQWGVGESGRMGALLSVSIGNIGNRTDSIQTGRFEPTQTAAGQTVYLPNAMAWRSIDWKQKRTAVAGALQWAPNDDLSFAFQGLYSKADPRDIEHVLGDVQGGYNPNQAGNIYGSDGVIQAGTISPFQLTTDTRYQESHKKTSDWSLNGKWNINDRLSLNADVQYVDSHADLTSMTAYTQLGGAAAGSLSFDLRGDTPLLTLTQPAQADQGAYWWGAAMDHLEDNDADSLAERLDADFKFEENEWLDSFRAGVRATDRNAITRQTGYNWGLLSQQFWGPGDSPAVYIDDYASSSAELYKFDNFFRGNVHLPGVAWFPTASVVGNGTQNAFTTLGGTESVDWAWKPLSTDYTQARPRDDNPNGGVNDQNEKTQAVYGMLRFAHDSSPLGPLDGNVGVRVVKTKVDATGLLVITPLASVLPVATCVQQHGQDACAALAAATTFSAGGNVPGYTQGNDYTDVLPSFNLRFRLTDDLQLRFAVGKAIVRPTFSQMMPYTSLSYTFESDGYTPDDVTPVTGTGGNPKLKPTRAKQFDTSVEWYFAPTGSLTFAGFYKAVSDYIFLGQGEESYTSNGQTQTFNVTRNLNGDKGKIKGFELAYTQFYDRLPGIFSGLGLQANFTLVDSSGGRNTAVNILEPAQVTGAADQTLPLEGLSKTSYNITGLYEKYDISARLAYNWRERYLLTTSAANIQRPVWMEDYGQLDASLFYSLTPKLKLGVQGTNLLNTRTFLDVGGAVLAPRYSWTDTDRRIAVAMRMQF